MSNPVPYISPLQHHVCGVEIYLHRIVSFSDTHVNSPFLDLSTMVKFQGCIDVVASIRVDNIIIMS